MKVNQHLTILNLPMVLGGNRSELNLSLIHADNGELALVDAGLPGSADAILEQISALGYKPSDLKRLLVTHHDIDHIGALAELKEKTGAEVYAVSGERPYIEGDLPFVKAPDAERLARYPELAELFAKFKTTKVEHVLEFGDTIEFVGGIVAVGTPGHTPGHTSFYLKDTRTLISGDALTSADGKLNGPSPQATPNLEQAKESVRGLLKLDIQAVVTYHGGLVSEDVPAQLGRVAGES